MHANDFTSSNICFRKDTLVRLLSREGNHSCDQNPQCDKNSCTDFIYLISNKARLTSMHFVVVYLQYGWLTEQDEWHADVDPDKPEKFYSANIVQRSFCQEGEIITPREEKFDQSRRPAKNWIR